MIFLLVNITKPDNTIYKVYIFGKQAKNKTLTTWSITLPQSDFPFIGIKYLFGSINV